MTDKHIQEMAVLTGQNYLARRNAFLASAPPLPEYPFGLTERDPHYRVQYLILRGWQQNAPLYHQMRERLDAADTGFMSRSASGFHPLWKKTWRLSETEWRYDGLAYAWEDIIKFAKMKPDWQIYNSVEIMQAFPHADSIDPLLIALLPEQDKRWRANWETALSKMPGDGLRARLRQDTDFYLRVRPLIQEALRRQQ